MREILPVMTYYEWIKPKAPSNGRYLLSGPCCRHGAPSGAFPPGNTCALLQIENPRSKIENEKEILPVKTYYEWIKPKPPSNGWYFGRYPSLRRFEWTRSESSFRSRWEREERKIPNSDDWNSTFLLSKFQNWELPLVNKPGEFGFIPRWHTLSWRGN